MRSSISPTRAPARPPRRTAQFPRGEACDRARFLEPTADDGSELGARWRRRTRDVTRHAPGQTPRAWRRCLLLAPASTRARASLNERLECRAGSTHARLRGGRGEAGEGRARVAESAAAASNRVGRAPRHAPT